MMATAPLPEVARPALPATSSAQIETPTRGQPEAPTMQDEPEIHTEEARMTGTHGRIILPFSMPFKLPRIDHSAHVSKPVLPLDFAHVGKTPEADSFSTLWGAAAKPVWRPKKFVRDDSYPKVTASGFYFRKDSGGFSLLRRSDRKCVGFYTKLSIQELEEQHGSKGRKTNSKSRRSRTGGRRNG